jgi:hypothetical protein
MKPLNEELTFASDSERMLADLVRSSSAYQASPFRKRLIRTRMQQAVRRMPGRGLRYAGAAALLLCTSAAAATLGYRFVATDDAIPSDSPTHVDVAPRVQAPSRMTPPPSTDRTPSTDVATPAAPERSPAPKTRGSADREKPKADGEDPSQMLEAVRALRKEGNPQHAQKLLDGYLASHPSGALSEDALALSIEAATARRDPRASEYARRYLAQYPNGRFRQLALRAAAAER